MLDTRKTTPDSARLEKMAAAAGGVTNHRMGLCDAVLIKNNHITAAGGVDSAHSKDVRSTRFRSKSKFAPARNWKRRSAAGAKHLLLDNLTPRKPRELDLARSPDELRSNFPATSLSRLCARTPKQALISSPAVRSHIRHDR